MKLISMISRNLALDSSPRVHAERGRLEQIDRAGRPLRVGLALALACAIGACGDEAGQDAGTPTTGGDTATDAGGGDAAPGDAASEGGDDADDAGEAGSLCVPGERTCSSARTYAICSDDGSRRDQEQCPDDFGCLEGECVEQICEAFEIRGCFSEHALDTCNFSGTTWGPEECPPFWTCEDGRCIEPPCLPDTFRCDGIDRLLTCDPDTGEFVEDQQCPRGMGCLEDTCQPLCEINEKLGSYVGCEYWSVDLDNLSDAESMEHTVVLSNPSETIDAAVEVTDPNGFILPLEDSRVPAKGQLVIRFPNDRGLIRPGVTDYSWRINSTVPVTAHQFNPLDNFLDPFTNDGTLLLPTHALGKRYFVLSWVHRSATSDQLNGFAAIVATSPDGAEIEVTAVSNTQTGDGQEDMVAGETRSWQLESGQVLNLETVGAGDDLTGTLVEVVDDGQIAVFGGHECANVVLGVDRCDHMETQLTPVDLLRNDYLAIKYQPRVEEDLRPEPDYWRVLAVDGATTIRTDPEIPDVDGAIIATGEWLEIAYREDFRITADRPIMVAHYMVGANWTGIPRDCVDGTGPPTGIGDPAMTQVIPIDQFRRDYIVLTPFAYVEDYLNLAVPSGHTGAIELDGELLPADIFEPFADGEYWAARIGVEDGPHHVEADVPFLLDAYGYSCHVSYAYPGGLGLVGLEQEE